MVYEDRGRRGRAVTQAYDGWWLGGRPSSKQSCFLSAWIADFTPRRRPVDRNEEARTSLIVYADGAVFAVRSWQKRSGRHLKEVWNSHPRAIFP